MMEVLITAKYSGKDNYGLVTTIAAAAMRIPGAYHAFFNLPADLRHACYDTLVAHGNISIRIIHAKA